MRRLSFVVFAFLFLVFPVSATQPSIDDILKCNVCVDAEKGSGSGPVVISGGETFVWTAGHVVAHLQSSKKVIDPLTGTEKTILLYRDLKVMHERYQSGRKVGEVVLLAKVIRYSDIKGGDDLALLKVYEKGYFKEGVKFLDHRLLPKAGTQLWHVGSMWGRPGINTPAEGIFSVGGRLRGDDGSELENAKIFDQITLPALPGSSGGGVYLKSNGRCVGLLTQGICNRCESINYIVPSRRIFEYAKRAKCLWAVSDDTKFNQEEAGLVLTDVPLEVPSK